MVQPTGTIEPLGESWQQKFARQLAALRAALNETKHPLLSLAERAALAAGGLKPIPPPADVGGLMSPNARPRGTGLGEFLIGDAPESFERWGRGDPPYTRGERGLAGRLPMLKPGRAQQAVDIASMIPLDLVAGAAAKPVVGVVGAVRKHGDVMPQKLAQELARHLTERTNVTPPLYEKLEKWITRSAGMDDPILQSTKKEDLLEDINHPLERLTPFGGQYYPTPMNAEYFSARGLPPPEQGSIQELVDTGLFPYFDWAINASHSAARRTAADNFMAEAKNVSAGREPGYNFYEWAKEIGMTPTNLARLLQILPKDNVIAYGTPYSFSPAIAFREVLTSTQNFLNSPYAPSPEKLAKMTFPQLIEANKRATIQALKELEKRKVGEVVMRLPDGKTWQKLRSDQLELEGKNMHNCVGQYCQRVEEGFSIYSLRDKENQPSVNISVFPDGYVEQIKGDFNSYPVDERAEVFKFLEKTGFPLSYRAENELNTINFLWEIRQGTNYWDLPKDARLWLNIEIPETMLMREDLDPLPEADYKYFLGQLIDSWHQDMLSNESFKLLHRYLDDFFKRKFDYEPPPELVEAVYQDTGFTPF